jgi:hypothetical protein
VKDPNIPFSNPKFGHKREARICPAIQPKYCSEVSHIWSSRRPNDVKFGGWKEKTILNNLHEEDLLKF